MEDVSNLNIQGLAICFNSHFVDCIEAGRAFTCCFTSTVCWRSCFPTYLLLSLTLSNCNKHWTVSLFPDIIFLPSGLIVESSIFDSIIWNNTDESFKLTRPIRIYCEIMIAKIASYEISSLPSAFSLFLLLLISVLCLYAVCLSV